MRVLLDTHLVLDLLEDKPFRMPGLADHEPPVFLVSVASLWEISIKARLGKLDPTMPLSDIEDFLTRLGVIILPVEARHVAADLSPAPPTRDPFDRLLLAICGVEGFRLATVDRALAGHPLALKLG